MAVIFCKMLCPTCQVQEEREREGRGKEAKGIRNRDVLPVPTVRREGMSSAFGLAL